MSDAKTITSSDPTARSSKILPVVGFALLSSRVDPIPSTRIACLNIMPHLVAQGFVPRILWEPATPSETPTNIDAASLLRDVDPDVVVFQKIRGPAVVSTIRALRERGIRTVWSVCDLVDNEMVAETDATIAVTEFLRSLYAPELQAKIHVVHDGIENESSVGLSVAKDGGTPTALLITSDELIALPVIGHAPKGWRVIVLGRYPTAAIEKMKHFYWLIRRQGWQDRVASVTALCDRAIRRIPWSPPALGSAIESVQLGIIPVDKTNEARAYGCSEPAWRVKSENRLTLLMAAGLPVIASPIPAYESVIQNGRNGFFANTSADWKVLFGRLRDAGLRSEVGKRARDSVLPDYSVNLQAEKFIRVIRHVLGRRVAEFTVK